MLKLKSDRRKMVFPAHFEGTNNVAFADAVPTNSSNRAALRQGESDLG